MEEGRSGGLVGPEAMLAVGWRKEAESYILDAVGVPEL